MTLVDLQPAVEPYLTREELARVLGVGVTTLDRLRKEGLPEHRWGRRVVRFRRSEAERWLRRLERERMDAA